MRQSENLRDVVLRVHSQHARALVCRGAELLLRATLLTCNLQPYCESTLSFRTSQIRIRLSPAHAPCAKHAVRTIRGVSLMYRYRDPFSFVFYFVCNSEFTSRRPCHARIPKLTFAPGAGIHFRSTSELQAAPLAPSEMRCT